MACIQQFPLNPPRGRLMLADPQPTEREVEILYLLSDGETISDVAEKFCMRRHTLQMQLHRMRELFRCATTAELIAMALRRGWII